MNACRATVFGLILIISSRWPRYPARSDQLVHTRVHVCLLHAGCDGTQSAKVPLVEAVPNRDADCKATKFPPISSNSDWLPHFLPPQIQFIIVFYHTLQVQFQPTCGYPKSIAALLTLNAGLFIYMFSTFYVRSYLRTARRNAAELNNNNNNNRVECKPKEVPQSEDSRTPSSNVVLAGAEPKKDL